MNAIDHDFKALLLNIEHLAASANPDKPLELCRLLKAGVSHYHWVGFYVAEPDNRQLRLGVFAGDATEHTLIPYGKGVCGQVALSERTLMIPDVQAEDNYLSCSASVRSEIVLPVLKDGRFVAQLDIDSHSADPFTDADRRFLEHVCEIAAAWFPCYKRGP